MVERNFLVVDDDEVCQFMGIRALLRMGFLDSQIQTALNGREAFEIINHPDSGKLPDVIFLDLNMPVMNGFEFLEIFKTLSLEKRNMKIVVLSSSNNPIDMDRAKKLGATQYLTKPMTTEMLKPILQWENVSF